MPLVTSKRIKHLARYFGLLAMLSLVTYYQTHFFYLLALLGPSFFLTSWLRSHSLPVIDWIPNEPFYNNFLLLLPVTVIYFGLVGFQLKNLINERGKIRILSILIFLGFLFYIHAVAFQELALYWEGSSRLVR